MHRLVERALGITTTEVHDALRQTVARVLLLAIVEHAAVLPERLRTALPLGSEAQKEARYRAVDEWWARYPETAAAAFASADKTVRLADDTPWADALGCVDVAPSVDAIALRRVLDLLATSDNDGALALATRRANGRWARIAVVTPALDDGSASRWRAAVALAELRRDLVAYGVPATSNSGEILSWYAVEGWSVDRSHRRLELALTGLAEHGALEQPVAEARAAYEDWLGSVIERYTGALEASGFSIGGLLRQAEVFPKFVKTGDVPTAYIWVDAFRFELATDVVESLRAAGNEVELAPAVAAAPTITPVGMANLCPGSDQSFLIAEEGGTLRSQSPV